MNVIDAVTALSRRAEKMRVAITEALEVYDQCGSISPKRARKLRESIEVDVIDCETLSPTEFCPGCGSPAAAGDKDDPVTCPKCRWIWYRGGNFIMARGYGG